MTSNVVLTLVMVGALSIVRFRSSIKEPLDIMYMFWAVAAGIAVGAGMAGVAVVGTLAIGLVVAFLFCKMNQVSIVEHILARITVIPLLSLPGMFICHFAVKMTWGMGFLLCFNWVLAITAVLFMFSVVKERRETAG